ncbi:hypothetical protein L6255_03560 [Candidatus Parcubacteria bacterium]|nr:hypothetical protein [Patescibacteria group bacterium]MBU4380823.1 hypothetical protein [Patescibacteria group bacterium]MCG2689488.1 hypothetical protein [Candidatus Parcubacteria bacterium]
MSTSLRIPLILFILSFFAYFVFWLGLNITSKNDLLIQSEDAIPATYLPLSLLDGRGFVLTEYYNYFKKQWPNPENKLGKPYYLFNSQNGEYISAFPVIVPILAVPFYLPVSILGIHYSSDLIPITARCASAFFVALSVVFVYLSLVKITRNRKVSILSVVAYAFGSICWGTTSQSLWQHGINQFLLSAGFYLLLFNKSYSSILFSLAVFSRPTNIIFAVWAFVYVLIKDRKKAFVFLLWSLPPLLFQFWYDVTYLGGVLNHPYSVQQFTNWQGRFPEGFLGLLISPSKGLLILSPVFIFALTGIYYVWRKNRIPRTSALDYVTPPTQGRGNLSEEISHKSCYKTGLEYKALSIALLVFFLVMGKWIHWYGGWSFGYRMVSEALPFLTIFLGIYLSFNFKKTNVLRRFYFLLIVSILVQVISLLFDFRYWHATYDAGPFSTSWLWSLKDSMLVYFARLALIKFGFYP